MNLSRQRRNELSFTSLIQYDMVWGNHDLVGFPSYLGFQIYSLDFHAVIECKPIFAISAYRTDVVYLICYEICGLLPLYILEVFPLPGEKTQNTASNYNRCEYHPDL